MAETMTGGLFPGSKPKPDPTKVATQLQEITKQGSPLMQQAKTDALKLANRRGLVNSSMAVGASQDAALRTALPIASQDASSALQEKLQAKQIASTEGMQAKEIASTEGMQEKQIAASMEMQLKDIASTEGIAAAERALREKLQDQTISAADRQQLRDIAFRAEQGGLDRALSETQQIRSLESLTGENALDRELQERLANLNLASNDRNAAATLMTNMEAAYNDQYVAIMSNPNLSKSQREQQLAAAKALRDTRLNFVEQMYEIDLVWGEADGDTGGGSSSFLDSLRDGNLGDFFSDRLGGLRDLFQ